MYRKVTDEVRTAILTWWEQKKALGSVDDLCGKFNISRTTFENVIRDERFKNSQPLPPIELRKFGRRKRA